MPRLRGVRSAVIRRSASARRVTSSHVPSLLPSSLTISSKPLTF
jgi:hypothetical protein